MSVCICHPLLLLYIFTVSFCPDIQFILFAYYPLNLINTFYSDCNYA